MATYVYEVTTNKITGDLSSGSLQSRILGREDSVTPEEKYPLPLTIDCPVFPNKNITLLHKVNYILQ